jgi:hypothetical protein
MCDPSALPAPGSKASKSENPVHDAAITLGEVLRKAGIATEFPKLIAAVASSWREIASAGHALHRAIAAEINSKGEKE